MLQKKLHVFLLILPYLCGIELTVHVYLQEWSFGCNFTYLCQISYFLSFSFRNSFSVDTSQRISSALWAMKLLEASRISNAKSYQDLLVKVSTLYCSSDIEFWRMSWKQQRKRVCVLVLLICNLIMLIASCCLSISVLVVRVDCFVAGTKKQGLKG